MSQSKGVITCCQQLVYITQWFTEMSELQTQDFKKYLIQKYAKCGQQLDNQFINGFNQMGLSDRPASIFQCRMKLFTEWFPQWSDEEKQELLIRLRNIDSKFMDEFQSSLESNSTAVATTVPVTDDYQHTVSLTLNGNIDDDSKSSEQLVLNGLNGDSIPENEEQIIESIDLKQIVDEVVEEVDEKAEQTVEEVVEEEVVELQPEISPEMEQQEEMEQPIDAQVVDVVPKVDVSEESPENGNEDSVITEEVTTQLPDVCNN